jgi:hypothetical protein
MAARRVAVSHEKNLESRAGSRNATPPASKARVDRLASETAAPRKLIGRLDQSILTKAFNGELVPQDPNDQPASVLLERIKAERQTALALPPEVNGKQHGVVDKLSNSTLRRADIMRSRIGRWWLQ